MTRRNVYIVQTCAIVVCLCVGSPAVCSIPILNSHFDAAFAQDESQLADSIAPASDASPDSSSFGTQSESSKRRDGSITGQIFNDSGQPLANAAVQVQRVGGE